ncbi:MAG TPA: 16S rRNA (cytidine(1402)-2'-O)-methyltransferase [Terriglobales bacterium]|nr:16S rRNA (cytidine(1402)-2'-O)-methyltransferase [Terriglobales bacterium]
MADHSKNTGAIYLVATPIGNLEDITLRALRILKEADLIACEDTRQTQKLLNHFGITTQTISYHEHNEAARARELVERAQQGRSIAIVSDAGMPGISDPGYRVVLQALEQGVPVIPVPGASALVASLAASGLPTDSFRFHGFLPPKQGQRQRALEQIRDSSQTEVFYEAPHRLAETLQDVRDVLGPSRPVVVAREITKLHEEFLRGRAEEVLQQLQKKEVRGEITLLIGKAAEEAKIAASPTQTLRQRMDELMREQNLEEKDALKLVAKERGVSKSEAYRQWQQAKQLQTPSSKLQGKQS